MRGVRRLGAELLRIGRRLVQRATATNAAGPPPWESVAEPALALRVGAVLDEFTAECFAPEVDLVPLDRSAGVDQLQGLDLVFVESAWRGNAGAWSYTINRFGENGAELRSLLGAAKAADIPSVFWNKEDPISFDLFLPAAKAFDVVVTTDADMIEGYRSATGHDRVAALPFAAQPRLHNPIGRRRGADVAGRVCFAGSWRGDKYPQRGDDFDTLLRAPLERGLLDIYDRYAGTPEAAALGFPDPYRDAVIGSLPYSQIGDAYRRYAAFLNVNSVSDSPTMFSRRVFELMACGSPVISTPSRGIEEILGDAVLITTSAEETAAYVEWVVEEPEARDRFAHRGYRLVHGHHTYRHRVDEILTQVGVAADRAEPTVSVLCVSDEPTRLDRLLDGYRRQTHPHRDLVFVARGRSFDEAELRRIEHDVPAAQVLRADESASRGECLNLALDHARSTHVALFDDTAHYGDHYLADALLAFAYAGSAVVGKHTHLVHDTRTDRTSLENPGSEFRHVSHVAPGTIVADRATLGSLRFEPRDAGVEPRFLDAVADRGFGIFSADRYNFCDVRTGYSSSAPVAAPPDGLRVEPVDVGEGLRTDAFLV